MAWFDRYIEWRDVWLDEGTKRRMRVWRSGGRVTLGAADRLMVQLGEHLGDLPEEVWADPPLRPRRGPLLTDRARLEAVERVRAGEDRDEIAAEYQVTRHAVCRWLRIFR